MARSGQHKASGAASPAARGGKGGTGRREGALSKPSVDGEKYVALDGDDEC